MNRFESEQYDRYYERRHQARKRLDTDKPKWYTEAKERFEKETDFETKKQYESELQQKINKYLDENAH